MRNTLFSWLIDTAMFRRKLVLLVTVLLTIGAGIASERLKFDMRWSALLPETLPVVKEFKKIDDNFYQPANMIIAISGPDAATLEQVTDEVTTVLQKWLVCEQSTPLEQCFQEERYARYVYGKLPEEWLIDHSLRLAKPNDSRRLYDLFRDRACCLT